MKKRVQIVIAGWMALILMSAPMNCMGMRTMVVSAENSEVESTGEEPIQSEIQWTEEEALTDRGQGMWAHCPEVFVVSGEDGSLEKEVDQESIDRYVQVVSELPAYLSGENVEMVSELLSLADGLYQALGDGEKTEPEVIAAREAWSGLVSQTQNTALTSGNVTINYVSPSELGEIENLVPRQGNAGPESESSAWDSANSSAANGVIRTDVLHDQETGGNQEMFTLSCDGAVLEASAKLTVRYTNIGTYYEGRIYTNQNVPGIRINAIVTISNPYNANRISLYENFWMGGTVNGGSGKLEYNPGTPGRADVSITFCDQNWNVVLLKEDAQLIASSISHGYYKGCSYEGISFSAASADTVVRIYSQSYGNIGIDSGGLFGLGQTFYGEKAGTDYCASSGGPHSGGHGYVDTRQSTTFMVHGVGFYQNAATWKMTMTTQTTYNGGHDYWFYFTAAPANMARPETPVKRVSKEAVQTGETLEYTLEQRLSTVQQDGYGYYGSLIFYDTLPAEVEYLSASMYLEGVDVTSSAGVLTYNAAAGKVTYTFSSAYLKNMDYRGQLAKLVIRCRLKTGSSGLGPITNKGHVSVCGHVESSTAAFTPLYRITTEVENGVIDPMVAGIRPGESRTICYSPQTGYVAESITVDGVAVEKEHYMDGYSFSGITSDHHIRVVYGITPADRYVQLTKRISASDIVFDHGEPTFLFRLEGTDIFGKQRVCYRSVSFFREAVALGADEDGYVSLSVIFQGLMPGVYAASEEQTSRYQPEYVIAVQNAAVDGDRVVFDLTNGQSGSAVFVNRKYEQGGFSDSCLVENVLTKSN